MGHLRTGRFAIYEGQHYSHGSVVRFKDDYLYVTRQEAGTVEVGGVTTPARHVVDLQHEPVAVWVKVVDGWSKNGNWGGHLQVDCATNKGCWIEGSNRGWAYAYSSKYGPISFVDKGDWYEIRQGGIDGAPMTIQDNYLRFVSGAEPSHFNIRD
ncbi:hypothetical protein EF912_27950 [Streptomyces sp. WAC07061]|uniref:hypothetical protein n=1 Tax=Streptomyces sp. WAC07061 TaxID=2487410 RepID=UPI000F7ABEB8|nr:hypothetical protein [Streptomyces sp. WAC07061]RSS45913.1 hypothetical protein EF912_27950 [Streptomyces sp. WAC07061]